jgi:eukaryotic-like serine/threonine-protein kinase
LPIRPAGASEPIRSSDSWAGVAWVKSIAPDTKLARDVAIKVLPAMSTADPERLARFETEARMLAALNHPHIGAIYGLEDRSESGHQVRFLVLELVDGETLAERIRRGPVVAGDALSIARQIADALDAAHQKGIVHRDLKPANIKITPSGEVKVLDFGLAKMVGGSDDATRDVAESPTVSIGVTRVGVILGTVAYMSPEQACGMRVDERTDIWAFGCVLYEMLTGRPVFTGETVSETIAAILEREPDWKALPGGTPVSIRQLLRRCLEKDSARRLQNVAEARRTIEHAQRAWRSWQIAGIAAAVALLATAGALWWRAPSRPADRSQWALAHEPARLRYSSCTLTRWPNADICPRSVGPHRSICARPGVRETAS